MKSFFKQELKEYRELSAKHKLYLWLKVGTLAVCIALWVLGYWIPALIASVFVAFDLYGIWVGWVLFTIVVYILVVTV